VNKSATEYKKQLQSLTSCVCVFIYALDQEMEKPSNLERGKRIAALSNFLDLKNDGAMHFTLGYSFKKMEKLKRHLSEEYKLRIYPELAPAVAGRE
jgi:hypothetical protein